MRSIRIRYSSIVLLLALAGTLTAASLVPAISADAPMLQVKTDARINPLDSAQIQVQVQHGAASSYAVAIVVVPPTVAGGPFCETVTVATDKGGNGHLTVDYPGVFTASACTPAGVGGSNTIVPGTYAVAVSSSPAITTGTLSTTFTVRSDPHLVTGTGTISSHLFQTNEFVAAPGGGFVSCTPGVTTTTPTSTTAPYTAIRTGSTVFTGAIATNTPGQSESHYSADPCVTPAVTSFNLEYTLNDVTVTLPDGTTRTGGLTLTAIGTSSGTATPTVAAGFMTHFSVTGSGRLAGATGFGMTEGSALTTGAISTYWIQLEVG